MLLSNNYSWDQPTENHADNFGNSFIAESENNTGAFDHTLILQWNNESTGAVTHLNANNANMDIQTEKYLAKTTTVKLLVKSSEKRRQRIIA